MIGITHKHHAGLCSQGFHSPRERLVGHVVLHDVHQRLVHSLLLAGELIESHYIPVTHQTEFTRAVMDEQLGNCNFATGYKNAVGRELRINVRLAGALRPQLDQVVIALAERDKADKLSKLIALAEHLRIETYALDQQVNPLISGELLTCLQIAVEIKAGNLNWL
ncbi:hypothetical protein D3C85_1067700 [compost metagenome]